MPYALTCECGVRLEIDDAFAGREVSCPDCQRLIDVPKMSGFGRRTSGLALASVILALVGAFTVVGSALAVVLGFIALSQIRNSRDLPGRHFAIAGIGIGAVMTLATVLTLATTEFSGLSGMLSSANWNGKLEYGGPLEVERTREGFAVKRPNERWGVYNSSLQSTGQGDNHVWDDCLFVLPNDDAIILCYAARVSPEDKVERCGEKFIRDFRTMEKLGLFSKPARGLRNIAMKTGTVSPAMADGKVRWVEMQIDKSVAGQDKRFLARVLKREDDIWMYVVITGSRQSNFRRLEGQFREAIDSFHLLARREDW